MGERLAVGLLDSGRIRDADRMEAESLGDGRIVGVGHIDTEVRQLGQHGPTPLEVEETRAYLIGSIPRLLETNDSIAEFLQSCEQFGLGLDYDRRLPALLESVTIDEIRLASAEVLCPERAAIAIAGPDPGNGLQR